MAYDVKNFSVTQVGQQVIVKGELYDSNTNHKVTDFGPNGTNFVTWFQQLPASAQIELVGQHVSPFMQKWLLGIWPNAGGGIG